MLMPSRRARFRPGACGVEYGTGDPCGRSHGASGENERIVGLSEADTRAKLIDPAILRRGWTEELIRREETAGMITVDGGRPRRQGRGRVDYIMRVKVNSSAQPVAVAVIEAKAEDLPPGHGLEQAKSYIARFNVPFVFSSNGHLYVEYDRFTGRTSAPCPLAEFPPPEELRTRYERGMGFTLADAAARPLLAPYAGGEATRRYYQDAAIRAVLERIARSAAGGAPGRALLSLATGAGKTFIAVNLLKRIADAGQLGRALFICDRDELRSQAEAAFQAAFGADAAVVSGLRPQKNARILIATYQTLGIDTDEADASFLTINYPPGYFSHIVIDECHRSAWGKWSEVLRRNPNAVQVGLTATPRQLAGAALTAGSDTQVATDARITSDNIAYFGEPVYEYDMSQGIEDGYLAACEVIRRDIFLLSKEDDEKVTGIYQQDLDGKRLTESTTGRPVAARSVREHYGAGSFERRLLLPDRVQAMAQDLFDQLLLAGGPEQKSIVFCASDQHADAVAAALNNLYAAWCAENGSSRAEPYAFKCTAANDGGTYLADLRGSSSRFFVATTVELLTTGVDVPVVRNIVFFRYVTSPIAFYQMVGRGTRLDPASEKLMFCVIDYTNASRLFGRAFLTRVQVETPKAGGGPPESPVMVADIEVRISDAGRLIVTMVNGKASPVTVEEYKRRLAARLVEQAPTLDAFRARWVAPRERRELLAALPDAGRSAQLIRSLESMADYDLYDVLAELGYGMAPRTRLQRAGAFALKHEGWLQGLPRPTARALSALTDQFARAGTEALENPAVFQTPEVMRAGGLSALKALGQPAEVLQQTKERLFAA